MCSCRRDMLVLGTRESPPQRRQTSAADIDRWVGAAVWCRAGTDQRELFVAGGIATAVTRVVVVTAWPALVHRGRPFPGDRRGRPAAYRSAIRSGGPLRLNAGGWRLGIGRADVRSPPGGHRIRRAGAAHRPELLEAGGESTNRAGVVEVRMGSAAGADSPPGLGLGPVPRRRRIITDPSLVGAHGVPRDRSRSATDQLRNIELLPSLNSGGQPLARAFSEKHRAG